MQKKIAEVLLRRIRSRSGTDATAATSSAPQVPAANFEAVTVREAQFSDFDEIYAMNRRLGQGADSPENWVRLWRDNPALHSGKMTPRIGWALLDSNKIVGFLGSVSLLYQFQGKALATAATCRFVVEPGYRSLSHLLVNSFFRQKDVDLFLNTTATVGAGKMMTALRALPVPQKDYGKVMFWVIRPTKFAQTVLQRAGLPNSISVLGGSAGALALHGDIKLRRRRPARPAGRCAIEELNLENPGTEFGRFLEERAREATYLFAKRSPEVMHWHFKAPGSHKQTSLLACRTGTRLVGYSIVSHESPKLNFRRSLIADLMVEGNDPDLLLALLSAGYDSANRAGSHVLELLGFPNYIRQACLRANPYFRDYPACPYFYRARDHEVQEQLKAEDRWYACPYDGDSTLWP